jgi:ABC-type antimicrobial peptide transport system permease subunit
MALGADQRSVLRMFLAQGMRLAFVGVIVGLGGGFTLSNLLRSQLYGVSTTDPSSYILVAIALVFAALIATWLPARRATRTDPMRELQSG